MGSQSEIFSRYRSMVVSNSQKPYISDAQKKLDKLEFIDFLIELVKSTRGQKEFKNLILKGSLSEVKKFDAINKKIKDSVIAKFGCDSNMVIPEKYTVNSVTGIQITKQEIDSFGLLNIDPQSRVGKLMYEGNDIKKHLNFAMYSAQKSIETNPIEVMYKDRVLFVIYSIDNNTFMFKFGSYYSKKLFTEFLSDYLEVAIPAFNFTNFMSILMDMLTGSLSLKGGVNKQSLKKQSSSIKGLKKMFGFCNEEEDTTTPDSTAKNFLNKQYGPNQVQKNGEDSGLLNAKADFDNVFNFNSDELKDIDNTVDQRSGGFIRFSSCGNLDIEINPDDIISSLEELFRNAQGDKLIFPSDNPQTVNPKEETGFLDNTKLVPDLDQAASLLDKGLKNGINKIVNEGEIDAVVDLPKINAEIQLNILKAIPYALMQSVVTPKVTIIPKLFLTLKGDTKKKSSEEVLSFMRPMITDLGGFITDLLVQNIFNLIKKDLINLAKKLTADFLKQRGLDYISTLKSLLSLLKALKGVKFKGCQSIIDQILRLLKLLNFTPMPPIPPPLVLVGGALKPGLNQVAMINDLKSNLSEKGIETAATFPDGTPNHLMIALEETVKLMVSHIKTNAKIDVTTVGTGLTTGYGQIQ